MSATSSIIEIRDYTEAALNSLVASSLFFQKKDVAILERERNIESYVCNFCTIKMKTSRRSGHTTSMIWVGQEFFSNPLFVGANQGITKNIERMISSICEISTYDAKNMVRNVNIIDGTSYSPDAIFVDEVSFLSQKNNDDILRFAVRCAKNHDKFCLVLIG